MECGPRRRLASATRPDYGFQINVTGDFDWPRAQEEAGCLHRAAQRHLRAQPRRTTRSSWSAVSRASSGRTRCEVGGRTPHGAAHRGGDGRRADGAAGAGRRAGHHLGRVLRARNPAAPRRHGRQRLYLGGAGRRVRGAGREGHDGHPRRDGAAQLRRHARRGRDEGDARRGRGVRHQRFPAGDRAHRARRARACARQWEAPAAGRLRAVGDRPRAEASTGSGSRPPGVKLDANGFIETDQIPGDERRRRLRARRRDGPCATHAGRDCGGPAAERSPLQRPVRSLSRLRQHSDGDLQPSADRHGRV